MSYYVYMILTKINDRYITYVGYTNNIKKRISLHNNSKGAKYTKGKYRKLIFKKKYKTKKMAMRDEYKLKKNRIKRNNIKKKFILNNENINTFTL